MTTAKITPMSVVSLRRCLTPITRLTAAISVVGTRLQINEEYRDYLAGKAIACARDISRLLGWKSPFDLQAS